LTSVEHRQKRVLSKLALTNKHFSSRFMSLSSLRECSIICPRYLKQVTNDRLLPFAENGGNVEQKRLHLSVGLKTMVTVFFALTRKPISSAAETSKSIKYCKPR